MKSVAIILAAGQGRRMGTKVAKQYLPLLDVPVLSHTLCKFEQSNVDEIIIVVSEGMQKYCADEMVTPYNIKKVTNIIVGGNERYESVINAVEELEKRKEASDTVILIHDGARPFIESSDINKSIECAKINGACILGVPVKDTIKQADRKQFVNKTIDREALWQVQTPQTFQLSIIAKAYKTMLEVIHRGEAKDITITDDAMVVENFSDTKVRILEGKQENIKLTNPLDMVLGELILKKMKKDEKIC